MIQPIKGTHDYLNTRLFNFIVTATSKWLERYNFSHIMTPILEPTELFKRSLGLQTDVVSKEMYTLQADEGAICLRPEATASTVRAFINNGIQTTPWKVYTWGPMFRHERPQKGRLRQFHQINIEVIGAASIAYDAEFIALLDALFAKQFALDTYALQINFLGTREDRALHKAALQQFLEQHSGRICTTCQQRLHANTLRIFDCKNPTCQELYEHAPLLVDFLNEQSQAEWQQLQNYLGLLGVSYTVQPRLVRGLDYYNKTVFEFSSTALGAQNAFCGGGRYDNLVHELGGKEDQPSFGAAIGIERLSLMLEPMMEQLPLPQAARLTCIIPLQEEQNDTALLLAQHITAAGITTETLLDPQSVKSKLRKANSMGAQYALIIGQEEQKNHTVTVKNMTTGSETTVPQPAVAQLLELP